MSTGSIVVIVINLLWLIPFIIFMVRKGQQASASRERRKRLLDTGRPATAQVLSVDESGPYYSHVPHLDFRLRVAPPGEAPFEASARGFFRRIDFARLQPGATVEVRYDPAERAEVAIVGDTLA